MSEFTSNTPSQSPKLAFIQEYIDVPREVSEEQKTEATAKFNTLVDDLMLTHIQGIKAFSSQADIPMNHIILDVPTPTDVWQVTVESIVSEPSQDVTAYFPQKVIFLSAGEEGKGQFYEYVLEQDGNVRRSNFDATTLQDEPEGPLVSLSEVEDLAVFLTGPEVRPHV